MPLSILMSLIQNCLSKLLQMALTDIMKLFISQVQSQ